MCAYAGCLRWCFASDFTAPSGSHRRGAVAKATHYESGSGKGLRRRELDSRVEASGVERSGFSLIVCKQ